MQRPQLFIFAGLPGVGKTTLSRMLARELGAVYLRIDTIEQALRDERGSITGPEGYVVAYKLAGENLQLGTSVVADSVNPIKTTRDAWREVAQKAAVPFVELNVICSDAIQHRSRIESRSSDIPGHQPPTWDEVQTRQLDPWDSAPMVIDTAGATASESYAALRQMLLSR